jgi:hypothetical protein
MSGTKRTPVGRDLRQRLTPMVIQAFKTAMPLRLHRERQLSAGESCPGVGSCPTCDEYEDAVARIARDLRISTHAINPVDVADVPPPPWFGADEASAWETARGLYCALCDAAGIRRSRRLEITDVHRAHRNIRWTERFCYIPEGPDVRQRARLRDFQRETLLKIYGTGFGEAGDAIRTVLGK